MKIVNIDAFDREYINYNYTWLQKVGSQIDNFLFDHLGFQVVIAILSFIISSIATYMLVDAYGAWGFLVLFGWMLFGMLHIIEELYSEIANLVTSWSNPLRRKKILKNNPQTKLMGVRQHNFNFFEVEYCEPLIVSQGSEIQVTLDVNFFYHEYCGGWRKMTNEKQFQQKFVFDSDHVGWREQLQSCKSNFRQEVESYLNQRNHGAFGINTPFRNQNALLEDEVKYILSKA